MLKEAAELEAAYGDLKAIYLAERRRPGRHPDFLVELLAQWEAAI